MEIVANYQFTATRRIGLLASLNGKLQRESMQTNWVTAHPLAENCNKHDSWANPNRSVPCESNLPTTPAIVEAQRWVYGQNSEVILSAQSTTVTPYNFSVTPAASCNAN